MQKLPATAAGESVVARGEPWNVVQRQTFDDCVLVTLRGTGADNHGRTMRLLAPFDRLTPASNSTRLRCRSRSRVLRQALRAVARAHDWSEPWSTLTARIDLLPWQVEPAMAAVAGATRLLLADQVGLGKTIQAGLIVSELRARGLVSRALVLTPASLRQQWAAEFRERFDLDALVLDHDRLTRLAALLPIGVNPWTTADVVISSIDLVKRAEVRRALDSVTIDVLIVDEAHHLTPASDRGAVVAELAARAPWVVLATATPHSGDAEAFRFLSQIGSADTGELARFQRSARDVGVGRDRHVHLHRVRPTRHERTLFDETLAYATALWRQRDRTARGGAVVASVICRRAVSSRRALMRTLERRRLLLSESSPDELSHPELPWLEEQDADGVGPDSVLGASRLTDGAAEIAWLDRLSTIAARVDAASKIGAIVRVLARLDEPTIVFSEYRDTLTEIEEQLINRAAVAALHGGLSSRERRDAIHRFANGGARVLLASDAAGEGLNLQEHCRLVINVELPWNPVRLEQRIGRVDRLGQRRRVHAIHLYHRDSFEDRVLARLQRRLAQACHDLQAVPIDEEAVAAAVFDRTALTIDPPSPTQPSVRFSSFNSVEWARLRRSAAALAIERHPRDHRRSSAACAVLPRRRRLARGIALLFEWDVHDQSARLVARQLMCVRVDFARGARLRSAAVRRWTQWLASASPVREEIERARARELRQLADQTRTTAVAIQERLGAIDAALRVSRQAWFQGSLFDRRAEQQAQAGRIALGILRAHVQRQLASAHALRTLSSAQPPRLVAAWPVAAE